MSLRTYCLITKANCLGKSWTATTHMNQQTYTRLKCRNQVKRKQIRLTYNQVLTLIVYYLRYIYILLYITTGRADSVTCSSTPLKKRPTHAQKSPKLS